MRIACIIMAHKDPQQIERLIKKFSLYPFDFYLHVDKKVSIPSFEYLASLPNVRLIQSRVRVRWASFSFLQAILASLKEVLATGQSYDFISIMSGQDYPIKPVSEFYKTLESHIGQNFISYEDDGKWWEHAISRIHKYHFTNFGFLGKYRLQFLLNALLPDRKFPLPYKLYGGPRAMCMTISSECAAFLVNFIESDKKLRRFIRFTWGPDEFVFPTLIMNSAFKDRVINDNFYYIDWTKGGANPKILIKEDFESLIHSDKMMARKFDPSKDTAILDLLDSRN